MAPSIITGVSRVVYLLEAMYSRQSAPGVIGMAASVVMYTPSTWISPSIEENCRKPARSAQHELSRQQASSLWPTIACLPEPSTEKTITAVTRKADCRGFTIRARRFAWHSSIHDE
eukprot:3315793-Prymnesium_polylepis.1